MVASDPIARAAARELAHVSRVEQHPRVSAATTFVDVNQVLLHVRQLG
jgi:hypothetical protein